MKKISPYLFGIIAVVIIVVLSGGAFSSLQAISFGNESHWVVKGDDYERVFLERNWECHVPLWNSDGITPVMVSCSSRDGRQEIFYDHSSGVWADELSLFRDFKTFEYIDK